MRDDEEFVIQNFILRGDLGRFTEIVNADTFVPPQESRELRETTFENAIGGYKLPSRVLPAYRWWEYYLHSSVHSSCCDVKALDVVGGGYEIEGEGVPQNLLDEAGEMVERSLDSLNDAARDWEATGWCDLECLPTVGGRLYCLNHLDSWTIWPTLNEEAYIQMRDSRWLKYAPLGKPEGNAYQCAHFNNNHYYKNTYYGVPDVISAIIQIESSYEALKTNQEYFARRGGYRWMLLLKSPVGSPVDLSGAADAKLIRAINYGVKDAGRSSDTDLLMIPIGSRDAIFQKLDADIKDMDWPQMLIRYRDDIRARHGVPPIRLGIVETGALGGNVGQEQLSSYNECIVKPKQRRWNAFLTKILQTWYDPAITFTFKPLEISELVKLAEPVTKLFNNMLLSRREAREEIGEPDMDDGQDLMADEINPQSIGGPGNFAGPEQAKVPPEKMPPEAGTMK